MTEAAAHPGSHMPGDSSSTLGFGDKDGFGRFGVLDEEETGLKCHECEWSGAHLGLHAAKAHELPARDYRVKHGLRRSKGLVSAATRVAIRASATRNYTDNGPLASSRDLAKANTARLAAARAASAEEAAHRDARMSAMPRKPHARRVVTCEQCGAQFCPIAGKIATRRFCSKSCASTYNRAQRPSPLPNASSVTPGRPRP